MTPERLRELAIEMCRPDILTDQEQTEIQDALDAYAALLEAKAPPEANVVQKIMARLADLLDEDQFNEIESMALNAGIQPPPEPAEAAVARLHPATAKLSRVSEHLSDAIYEMRNGGLETMRASIDGMSVHIRPEFTESEQAGKGEQPIEPQAARPFPIMTDRNDAPDCPRFIRWDALNEDWAHRNHNQTLSVLARRGGLSPCEAVAIIQRRNWRDMDRQEASDALKPFACAPLQPTPPPEDDLLKLIAHYANQIPEAGPIRSLLARRKLDRQG